MNDVQEGIFVEESRFHYVLEYTLREQADGPAVRAALKAALGAVDPNADTDGQWVVVALGPAAWGRIGAEAPPRLTAFTRIVGTGGKLAPATQRDVWFWIHGPKADECFARAREIDRALRGVATLELEQPGWVFRDLRDLTGFVDGTANPEGEERREVAQVAASEMGAGGSYVLTQRWIHDLDAWDELSQGEQQAVIGRAKPDSVELEGDAMPADSHVSRADVKEDGVELALYRRSFPFGQVAQHGLYFQAFACDPHRFDAILRSIYGLGGDGIRDRLTDFSRAVSGSYFFAPSASALHTLLS